MSTPSRSNRIDWQCRIIVSPSVLARISCQRRSLAANVRTRWPAPPILALRICALRIRLIRRAQIRRARIGGAGHRVRTLAANERRWQDILAKTDGDTMILHCQSILFDLDGVLIDSCAVTERHLQAWAQRHGVELAQLLALHHGRTTVETLRAVAPHLNAETEARELESAEERDLEGLRAFPGASRLLAELERQPWAIVTSCKR